MGGCELVVWYYYVGVIVGVCGDELVIVCGVFDSFVW